MIHGNDNSRCTCSGPICSCGALGVVKDGSGVRVPANLMDSATGNLVVDGLTIDRATFDAYMASSELAYDQSVHRSRNAYLGDLAPAFTAADAAQFLAGRLRNNERLQQNIAAAKAQSQNPEAYARDGRLLSDLNEADRARETMIDSYNNWRK